MIQEEQSERLTLDTLAEQVHDAVATVNTAIESLFTEARETGPSGHVFDHLYMVWDRISLFPFFPEEQLFTKPLILFKPQGSGEAYQRSLRHIQSWLLRFHHNQAYPDACEALTTALGRYHQAYLHALDALHPQRLLPCSRFQPFAPDHSVADPLGHYFMVYPTKVIAATVNPADPAWLADPQLLTLSALHPLGALFGSEEGIQAVSSFYASQGQAAYLVRVHPRIDPKQVLLIAMSKTTHSASHRENGSDLAGAFLGGLRRDLGQFLNDLHNQQQFQYGICAGQPGSESYVDLRGIDRDPALTPLLSYAEVLPRNLLPALTSAPSPAELDATLTASRAPARAYAMPALSPSRSGPPEVVRLVHSSPVLSSGYLS